MEFLVRTITRVPPGTDAEVIARLRAEERQRADELRAAGALQRLWRVPGKWATVALYEAADPAALHEIVTSLPMWPYNEVDVEALATHPQEAAARAAAGHTG